MGNPRLTPEEYRLLQARWNVAPVFGKKPAPVVVAAARRKRSEELPENQVEHAIVSYLRLKGWIVRRQQVGTYVPYYHAMEISRGKSMSHGNVIRIGERGESDYECIRARPGEPGRVDHFTLETKAQGKQPTPEQHEWMRKRTLLGFVAVWFDSLSRFAGWYEAKWDSR